MVIIRHYWISRNSKIRCIFEFFSYCLLIQFGILVCANAGESTACPSASPSMGVIFGGKLYNNSIVVIEKNAEYHVINLSLYRPQKNGCKKTVFANYSREGGDPNVDSVFFLKINGKPNIVTIVHWDVNSRGMGTYGKYYQIYAYVADGRGELMGNIAVVNNNELSGMDGYQEGRQTSFPYKNAESVKSFFRCAGTVCK